MRLEHLPVQPLLSPCRLVHASTGACLLFKGDGTPGAGDCSSGEAKLTYTKGKLWM